MEDFIASVEALLKDVSCGSYDICQVTVLSFCGQSQNKGQTPSLHSRRLEIMVTVQFEFVILMTCNTFNCSNEQESIGIISDKVAATGLSSIHSGQFILGLSKNITSGATKSLLACAVTWGVIGGASVMNFMDLMPTSSYTHSMPSHIGDSLFYPVSHVNVLF